MLLCVGSFSYTPMLFPVLFYVVSVSYTLCAKICLEDVLHTLCCFMSEVCLGHPLLFHVGSFYFMWGDSYMPHAVVVSGEFLLHALCCFMRGVCLTRAMLFYVGSFCYTPLAPLCG